MANGSAFAEFLLNKVMEKTFGSKSRHGGSNSDSPADLEARLTMLQKACADYQVKHQFKVGDVVTVKDNMESTRKWPVFGDPAVVVEVLREPIVTGVNRKTIGTPQIGEVLDIRLACQVPQYGVVFILMPSVYFQPWEVYQASINESVAAAAKIVTEAKTE